MFGDCVLSTGLAHSAVFSAPACTSTSAVGAGRVYCSQDLCATVATIQSAHLQILQQNCGQHPAELTSEHTSLLVKSFKFAGDRSEERVGK